MMTMLRLLVAAWLLALARKDSIWMANSMEQSGRTSSSSSRI